MGQGPPGSWGSLGSVGHGRWSIIARPTSATAADDLADRVASQLLLRYGVAMRELYLRESFALPWRDIVRALRRREARGLVRGGRFIAGFLGEQYALDDAVDGLRRTRRQERTGEVVRVRACDPLNLVGIMTPGPRVPANHGPVLVFADGAFVQSTELPATSDRRRLSPSARAPRVGLQAT